MRRSEIKTIDINTKTWFDKINGNTYFAQEIVINYAQRNERRVINRFQYGYSSFRHFAFARITEALGLRKPLGSVWGAKLPIIRENLQRGCKKRELMAISCLTEY